MLQLCSGAASNLTNSGNPGGASGRRGPQAFRKSFTSLVNYTLMPSERLISAGQASARRQLLISLQVDGVLIKLAERVPRLAPAMRILPLRLEKRRTRDNNGLGRGIGVDGRSGLPWVAGEPAECLHDGYCLQSIQRGCQA